MNAMREASRSVWMDVDVRPMQPRSRKTRRRTAITAVEAISMAESEKPDLVIMDIRLAGRRDGVEAAIEIFSTLGIRSIFASAHADNETRKRAAPASPIGWLQKPYPADDLLRLLRGFYQSRDRSAT